MNTKAMFFALLLLGTLFSACEKENVNITPSPQVSTMNFSITAFDELDVSDPFDVYITFSDSEEALQIQASSNLHSVINVKQKDGKLSIYLDDDVNLKDTEPVLKVYLTTSEIDNISGAGLTEFFLQNAWFAQDMEIKLAGASTLEGELHADDLEADLTGASKLLVRGTAEQVDVKLEGACELRDLDFVVNHFSADMTGASEAQLTVEGSLEVKATGASTVYYLGDGVIQKQNLSGGSEIIHL